MTHVPEICKNPTPIFDAYFKFAHERHQIYLKQQRGYSLPEVLTLDPILQTYRFTNVFRAADRVSQYLIREVIPKGSQEPAEVLFRILLFKVFNKIETWEGIVTRLESWPQWSNFDPCSYSNILEDIRKEGPVYSSAYVMPDPDLGNSRKHTNHLQLLCLICGDSLLLSPTSQHDMYHALLKFPGIGPFLAYQYTIDLTYSRQFYAPDHGFVVAGPGAKDGIRKCFGLSRLSDDQVMHAIQYTAAIADEKFAELGLEPPTINGYKLELIDYQNLFCEIDKYSRVAFPEVVVGQKRTKIKQRYRPNPEPLGPFVAPESWILR